MPQLDKFAFAPQVFWLVLVFLLLYLLILKDGLPRLYRILLFRKRSILLLNTTISVLLVEIFIFRISLSKLITSFTVSRATSLENFYKVLDSGLNRSLFRNLFLRANRINLTLSFNTVAVGRKQFCLPTVRRYSSLKIS